MVQCQGNSIHRHLCRGSEGVHERHPGDDIQSTLPNQKRWWCFGCQWLQERGLLQEFPNLVKKSFRLQQRRMAKSSGEMAAFHNLSVIAII